MDYIYYATDYSNSLYHHGIHGMHWGVRRFQNPDGSWTTEGLKRRRKGVGQVLSEHKLNSLNKKMTNASKKFDDYYDKASNAQQQSNYYQSKMTEAQANYALAKANKQKHENSLGAKVIGVNKSKLNKYDKQMEDAQNDYNENEALKLIANAEMQKMAILGVDAEKEYAYYEDKAMKQIDKYLDKYGEQSMDEFMKKHNDSSDELASSYVMAKAIHDEKKRQNTDTLPVNVTVDTVSNDAPDFGISVISEVPGKSEKLETKISDANSKVSTTKAIDDYTEVLNGNMTKEEYNKKYHGTGYKIT